jgi:hypothetical protein
VPTIQGYEDAGDFTMTERLKTSIHANLVFYLCIGAIGLFGLILLILLRRNWFASSLSNSLLLFIPLFDCDPSFFKFQRVPFAIMYFFLGKR